MKLTHLAIDGFGVCRDLQFGQFDDGLNVIFGATGSGKTTLRRFVRGVLFGFSDESHGAGSAARPFGQMDVVDSAHHYRLQRGYGHQSPLEWNTLSNHPYARNHSPADDFLRVGSRLYDSLLNLSFHDTRENMQRVAEPLQTMLGVPLGSANVRDEHALAGWASRRAQLRQELSELEKQSERVATQRKELQLKIDHSESDRQMQLSSVDDEIASVDDQLGTLQSTILQTKIQHLQADVDRLRKRIEEDERKVTPVEPVTNAAMDSALYRCLDELDVQIRQWQSLQAMIQQRRIELRNEMMVWNEMTTDSARHPYHQTQILLRSLESQVEQTESIAAKAWPEENPLGHNLVAGHCRRMREDIGALCHELGSQFKHVRHIAGVAELKQLRERFQLVAESIEKIDQRRNQLVAEIRRLDPAGAAAIVESEPHFIEFARREGFWAARERFVSAPLRPNVPVSLIRVSDSSTAHERLAEVEAELASLLTARASQQSQRTALEQRRVELVGRRDAILSQWSMSQWLRELEGLKVEQADLQQRMVTLEKEISLKPQLFEKEHPFLSRVASLLQVVTSGDLRAAWISDETGNWVVQNNVQVAIPFGQLSRGQMDLVYLCVCLATAEQLRMQSIELPVILDDVFANLDPHCVKRVLDLLQRSAETGLQLIVLAKHNEVLLSDAHSATVFELPQTTVAPIPFNAPSREPYAPVRRTWNNDYFPTTNMSPMDLNSIPKVPLRPVHSIFEGAEVNYPWAGAQQADEEAEHGQVTLGERTSLGELRFLDLVTLQTLKSGQVEFIGELLDLNPSNLPEVLVRLGIGNEQLNRWQSLAWLMVCVPGLRAVDAKLLYACGITEPEQLDTTTGPQLLGRVHRYLASGEGSRFASVGTDFDSERLNRWYAALDKTRPLWRTGNGYSRRVRNQHAGVEADVADEVVSQATRAGETRLGVFEMQPRNSLPTRKRVNAGREPVISGVTTNRAERKSVQSESRGNGKPNLKFYLDLENDLEAAPSIGPKTAERFAKIDIVSVGDFLKQTADSMAEKLNYKRISSNVIRQWQQQTRLVCRIPNLRGHDAQLLVACGFVEPEDVAAMDPEKLFDLIGPFSETKEGLKIIRSSKKPNLEEVQDWVDWARNMRSLQAA